MALADARPRRPMHTRRLEMCAFARDDGLWDFEAHLVDSKPFGYIDPGRGEMMVSQPVHDLWVRLSVDDARVIREVDIATDAVPFGTCHEVRGSLRPLIGQRIGAGWRKVIAAVPRSSTCAHVHELLIPLASAVHQALSLGREPEGRVALQPDLALTKAPFFVDDCHSWRSDGAVVARFYPQLARKRIVPGE